MVNKSQTIVRQIDQKRAMFFGMLILLIMLIVSSVSGYFSFTLQRDEESRFARTIGAILSESIKRISFSGKYHTRLLLEDLQKNLPQIAYISVETIDGIVVANTDSTRNDTFIAQGEKAINLQALEKGTVLLRERTMQNNPVKEVLLPYRTGFDTSHTGIIRIGIKVGETRSQQRNNQFFHIFMILILTVASVWIMAIISRYFSRRLIFSEQAVRESESRLQTLLHNIPDLVWLKDKEGRYLSCNRTFENFFGAKEADIRGNTDYDFVARELADSFRTHDRKAIATGKPSLNEEWVTFAADGHRALLDILKTPMYDEGGTLIGVLGIGHDITTRKQAEEELLRFKDNLEEEVRQRTTELLLARDAAEAANKAKSVFLANMSHELRTPLNAVLGFSQLMMRSPDITVEQRDNLNIITRSGEYLLNLINNVLDISKIESGRVELEESHLDLYQLVQEMKSLMYVRANEKGLDFLVEQSPDMPRYVSVDGGKLRQVLINLIGNAIKYTKQGGVTLRTRVVGRDTAERVEVGFEIEDTGSGIPPEDRKRIFSPFVQLGDRTHVEAGTGLGLAICRQYIKLMGGKIGVADDQGKGSIFHFEIPVTVVPAEAISVEPQRGRIIGIAEGQPCYRILIVEDQLENSQLLCHLLEPLGFDLRVAGNGQEAVTLFEQWHPQLIWMDIRMPVMDGLEATRRIRSIDTKAETKIVAVTAHALEEERREILAAGCDDFIRKPYEQYEIFDSLARNLGVRFAYEDETDSTAGVAVLDVAALNDLPDELQNELEQALVRIDTVAVGRAIENIRSYNPLLADVLAVVANDLQYGQILRLLRSP